MDIDRVGERDPQLHEQWQQFSEEAQDAKVEADEATQRVKDEEKLLKQFKRAKAGRHVDGLTDEPRSLPICALQVTTPEGIDRRPKRNTTAARRPKRNTTAAKRPKRKTTAAKRSKFH